MISLDSTECFTCAGGQAGSTGTWFASRRCAPHLTGREKNANARYFQREPSADAVEGADVGLRSTTPHQTYLEVQYIFISILWFPILYMQRNSITTLSEVMMSGDTSFVSPSPSTFVSARTGHARMKLVCIWGSSAARNVPYHCPESKSPRPMGGFSSATHHTRQTKRWENSSQNTSNAVIKDSTT